MHQVNLQIITFLFATCLRLSPIIATNNDNNIVVSLNIKNSNVGQTIPSTMHGVIFETNINRADDGGLYAELIYNRAFQGWTVFILSKSIMYII